MEKLLNIHQVSELIGIKEGTLRAWIFQRRIPFIKIGALVRFREKEIESWLSKSIKSTN